jgi:hypothetical protein
VRVRVVEKMVHLVEKCAIWVQVVRNVVRVVEKGLYSAGAKSIFASVNAHK